MLRSLRLSVLAFVTVCFAIACTSTDITSTVDPDYTKQVESLYVAAEFAEDRIKMGRSAVAHIDTTLGRQSIPTDTTTKQVELQEGPELEEKEGDGSETYFPAARDAGVTGLLFMRQLSRDEQRSSGQWMPSADGGAPMYMGGSSKNVYVIDASFYDMETGDRVWRATVELTADKMAGQGSEGRTVGRKVLEKMREDGLFPSNMRSHFNRNLSSQ